MSAFEWAGWQAFMRLENDAKERGRLKAEATRNAKGRTARMRRR